MASKESHCLHAHQRWWHTSAWRYCLPARWTQPVSMQVTSLQRWIVGDLGEVQGKKQDGQGVDSSSTLDPIPVFLVQHASCLSLNVHQQKSWQRYEETHWWPGGLWRSKEKFIGCPPQLHLHSVKWWLACPFSICFCGLHSPIYQMHQMK